MRYIYKAAHDQKALESQVIKTLTDRSLSGDAYKAICIGLETDVWDCQGDNDIPAEDARLAGSI